MYTDKKRKIKMSWKESMKFFKELSKELSIWIAQFKDLKHSIKEN